MDYAAVVPGLMPCNVVFSFQDDKGKVAFFEQRHGRRQSNNAAADHRNIVNQIVPRLGADANASQIYRFECAGATLALIILQIPGPLNAITARSVL